MGALLRVPIPTTDHPWALPKTAENALQTVSEREEGAHRGAFDVARVSREGRSVATFPVSLEPLRGPVRGVDLDLAPLPIPYR